MVGSDRPGFFDPGRSGLYATTAPETAWAVIGSVFMFRMVLYLYELKHATRPEPLGDTLGYFFLLPNFCFTWLFPVVDYRTLQQAAARRTSTRAARPTCGRCSAARSNCCSTGSCTTTW